MDVFLGLFGKFYNLLARYAKKSEYQYIPLGTVGVVGFILYYFIWQYISGGQYHDIPLRVIGGLLCLLLALKNYWPEKLKLLLPIWWYITLLYCFPFFFCVYQMTEAFWTNKHIIRFIG